MEPQEVQIFKRLAYKSALEVGLEFKFDQIYKDKKAIRNAIGVIYRKVKDNPKQYGIAPDTVSIVCDAMAHRNLARARTEVSQAEREIDTDDIRALVTGVRDKTFRLLNRKLDRVSKSNKKLDSVSFRDLGTIGGIAFDKSQIIMGQATEHVAHMAKIEGNINPVDAIALVLQMREKNVAEKADK